MNYVRPKGIKGSHVLLIPAAVDVKKEHNATHLHQQYYCMWVKLIVKGRIGFTGGMCVGICTIRKGYQCSGTEDPAEQH